MTTPASSGSAGVNDRASWQQTLDDTVGALQSALTTNLYSVVLYASRHWPTGHRRHPEDALAFLRFLAARGLRHDPIERIRLETRLSHRRRCLRLVPRVGIWRLPALFCSWLTERGWNERILHVGPLR